MSLEKRIADLELRIAALEGLVKREPTKLPSGGAKECEKFWLETLKFFGIDRPILPHEQAALFQLCSMHDFKSVVYAIVGMRYEESSQSFDPKKNISLRRAFDPKLFEKFINLSSQKKAEQDKKKLRRE